MSSLMEIVTSVAQGQLPRDAAIEMVMVAFQLDRTTALRVLGSAGSGFIPSPTEAA